MQKMFSEIMQLAATPYYCAPYSLHTLAVARARPALTKKSRGLLENFIRMTLALVCGRFARRHCRQHTTCRSSTTISQHDCLRTLAYFFQSRNVSCDALAILRAMLWRSTYKRTDAPNIRIRLSSNVVAHFSLFVDFTHMNQKSI